MIGALSRAFDRFRGSGDAAVTIPSMDGAFRPNHKLDTASAVLEIAAPDNIGYDGRRILFTSDSALFELKLSTDPAAERIAEYEHPLASLDVHPGGAIALGLASGGITLRGGDHDGRRLDTVEGRPILCPTAVRFIDAGTLLVCLGSQRNDPTQWTRDLLDGNSSGSVWRLDIKSGKGTCLADRLAWPNGVIVPAQGRVVIAEAWRHQLIELAGGRGRPLLSDIPGYPARIAPATNGYLLAIFAPRSQLVEFVLREPRFRQRMMREVDPRFWVAPSLHHALDYREPLQSGAIKQLGELKPWAPSRSYGLIAGLDYGFDPIISFHSRADGKRHGITSCIEADGRILATSKGGNLILGVEPAREEGPVP
jgi:hypothetical protein